MFICLCTELHSTACLLCYLKTLIFQLLVKNVTRHPANLIFLIEKASLNRIEFPVPSYVAKCQYYCEKLVYFLLWEYVLFLQQVMNLKKILRFLKRLLYRYTTAFFFSHCNILKHIIALKLFDCYRRKSLVRFL